MKQVFKDRYVISSDKNEKCTFVTSVGRQCLLVNGSASASFISFTSTLAAFSASTMLRSLFLWLM